MTAIAKLTTAWCALSLAATAATGAWADEIAHSQVRLLQGDFAGGSWSVGVQVDLADGWKTYWRMPGEAGIAPLFDWTGSRNVADVEVQWPAPARFADASGETIGYDWRVVFPVSVRPEDPSRPVDLSLKFDYAVCNDVCIPARVDLSRKLAPETAMSSAAAAVIGQFERQVPRTEAPGLAVEGARLEDSAGALRLAVELSGEAVDPSTEIFVENFDAAYFRAPRPGERRGGTSVFHIPIDDLADPNLLRGRTLRLTVVTATAQLVGDVTVE